MEHETNLWKRQGRPFSKTNTMSAWRKIAIDYYHADAYQMTYYFFYFIQHLRYIIELMTIPPSLENITFIVWIANVNTWGSGSLTMVYNTSTMPFSSMTLGECFQTFPHPTTAAFLTLGLESFNPADIAENKVKRTIDSIKMFFTILKIIFTRKYLPA